MFFESLEKRGEESLEKRREREEKRAWRSEGGGAWRSKEGLLSTRSKEVSANPKLSHFFCHCFLYFLSSLSYTFPFFLLVHLFAGCPPSIFILKDDVSLGSMYHSPLGFDDGKGE